MTSRGQFRSQWRGHFGLTGDILRGKMRVNFCLSEDILGGKTRGNLGLSEDNLGSEGNRRGNLGLSNDIYWKTLISDSNSRDCKEFLHDFEAATRAP